MLYAVTATVTTQTGKWATTRQVPTFYLNSEVQGILSKDHAAEIAEGIINPLKDKQLEVDITVYEAGTVSI